MVSNKVRKVSNITVSITKVSKCLGAVGVVDRVSYFGVDAALARAQAAHHQHTESQEIL